MKIIAPCIAMKTLYLNIGAKGGKETYGEMAIKEKNKDIKWQSTPKIRNRSKKRNLRMSAKWVGRIKTQDFRYGSSSIQTVEN